MAASSKCREPPKARLSRAKIWIICSSWRRRESRSSRCFNSTRFRKRFSGKVPGPSYPACRDNKSCRSAHQKKGILGETFQEVLSAIRNYFLWTSYSGSVGYARGADGRFAGTQLYQPESGFHRRFPVADVASG